MPAVRFDSYRTLGFASISGTFATVGTALSHRWRAVRISNHTDGDMIFSVDATNNNFFVPANSFVLYDITTNTDSDASEPLLITPRTQFYVKQSTAPTQGAVYIEGFYAQGQ